MSEIVVEITVPESEYKNWNEFAVDGIDGAKIQLKKDFSDACKKHWIHNAEIEVIHKP